MDRPKATLEIESVSAISDRALKAYVVSRGIPLDLARLYLKEVAYRVGEHGYLNHDSAGEKGLATLRERGLWEVVGTSRLYDGFKDANEFWA